MIKLVRYLSDPLDVQDSLDHLYSKGFTLTHIRLGCMFYSRETPAKHTNFGVQDGILPITKYPIHQKSFTNPPLHILYSYGKKQKKEVRYSPTTMLSYYNHMIYEYNLWTIRFSILAIAIALPLLFLGLFHPALISTLYLGIFLFVFYRTLVSFRFKKKTYNPLKASIEKDASIQ